MRARKIGRTRSQSYTLDYDEASFNQVEFLTMSNVYCSMTVVALEEFPKRKDKKTKRHPRLFAATTQAQLSASTVPPRSERLSRDARSGRSS